MNENPRPLPVIVMGVPFHDVTFAETVAWAEAHIARGRPGYIATANLDFVMQAHRDPELQRILLEADLVVADGAPLVRLSGWLGPRLRERVTGSDLAPMLAEMCARRGWPLFALGAAPGVADKALSILRGRYPGLPPGGFYSPPQADILDMDHADILARLRTVRPALILVAFGAPKQEKWINMHFREWLVPLAIGVGGTLDFLAGRQTRAPRWVQRMGLEWFWRMGTNPKRLFKRYAANAVFLAITVLRHAWLRRAPVRSVPAPPPEEGPLPSVLDELRVHLIPWKSLPDLAAAHVRHDELAPLAERNALVFDLAGVPWLCSHEWGLLVALNAESRARGHEVVLWRPGPRVLRFLAANRLGLYLCVAPRAGDWISRLRAARSGQQRGQIDRDAAGRMRLRLPAELTAANLTEYRSRYERSLPPGGASEVAGWIVDAAHLRFLDSAALGFLVGLKKSAAQNNRSFESANWDETARQILRTAKMEALFIPSPPPL